MKSTLLLFSMVLFFVSSMFAQGYDPQYVSSTSGDTLVVKDDNEFGSTNTLYLQTQFTHSLAPRGPCIYATELSLLYSCANNPVTSSDYRTIIMGPTHNSV